MDAPLLFETVLKEHDDHVGQAARGMNWRYDKLVLACSAACLGGNALASIFETLAKDYGYFAGGMPDLLLWKVNDLSPSSWSASFGSDEED